MRTVEIEVKQLHEDAVIPEYKSEDASGVDLHALKDYAIAPNQTVQVLTGIAFGIPSGYEIQVRPRSGLSLKTGLRVANSPGTVDSDYTGDCSVLLWNTSNELIIVKKGDRIGQAVLCPVFKMYFTKVTELKQTKRGTSGFGSSGV